MFLSMQPFILLFITFIISACTTTSQNVKPSVIELPDAQNIKSEDLGPVRNQIGNKRIVMLGESIHITSEFSKARNALIQNLHEQGSYNILLFEGSPIEFWIAQDEYFSSKRDEQAVADFQKTALFGLWQTPEIRSVIAFGLASQNIKNQTPLYISSYDVQIGQGRIFSSGKRQVLPEFVKRLKKLGSKLSSNEENKVLSLENLVYCKRKKYPTNASDYEASLSAINLLKNKIENNSKIKNTTHRQFLSFIPESLRFSLDFCKEANSSNRNYTEIRDEWASRQFQAILDQTNEKVMIWAHSGHVRQGPTKDGRMSFGSYTRLARPNDVFSISFTAKEGSIVSFMDEKGNETELAEKKLTPVEKASLEYKFSKLSNHDFFYLSKKSDKYFKDQETGRTENIVGPMHPYLDFDGYYFIQKVSAPRLFLP